MRIMLLGGAGFIGINLALKLARGDSRVFVADRQCRHLKGQNKFACVSGFHDIDIADVESVIKLVDDLAIDCVISLVSSLVPSSLFDKFILEMTDCVLPSFRLVQLLSDRKVKYVFSSSGGAIYGRDKNAFVAEEDQCSPINYYGYSKRLFEEYLELVNRISGLDYLVIRPSNPYGAYQQPARGQGFVAVAMNRLIRGEAIEIWGDGSVIRDYIWIDDLTDAIAGLLDRNIWNETFNIGTGVGHTLNEVIAIAEAVTGIKADIVFKDARPVDVERVVLDVTKLKGTIHFSPISLEEGIGLYFQKLINGQLQ